MTVEFLTLPDGRVLEYGVAGNPEGATVVFHHGTPGSFLGAGHTLFDHEKFFVVSYSRAGYGNSTRYLDRDVAAVVADVTCLLDHLGRDRYVAVGWSGGGPHALACGALDAPRCAGVISLASVAPADVDFDWTEGMAKENLEEFALAKEGGAAYEAHMAATGEAIRAITNDNFFDVMGDLWPPVDRVAIEDKGQVSAFVDDFVLAFQDGHGGYLDDNVAFFKPWGFSVAQVKVPVALYFGDADAMVPPSHGRWLAENIDGAQVHFSPGGGHISVVYDGQDRIGHEILEFLTV